MSEGDQHLPAFLDFEQELAPETLETVGVKQGNVWESTLDRSVPEIVGRILPGVIARLLRWHALRLADVSHWAFHTGGRRVLEVSQQGLGLSDAQMAPSYEVLRRHGNMGSGTVIHSLAQVLSSSRPAPGERGLLVSVGPGMVIGAALVCWEGT
ncbi:Polyketide synthase-like Pks10 [compost metagenome]